MKEQPTKNNSRKKSNTNSKKNSRKKSSKKKSNVMRLSQKGLTTIVVMLLTLVIVLIMVVSSFSNSNNVDKVTDKLSSCVGSMSVEEVKKSTRISFYQSASNETLANLTKFNYISESRSSTSVCGTKLPKWVAYAKTNKSANVTQFTIYNFTVLESNVLGEKVNGYISTADFVGTSESVLDDMGIKPYITTIAEDASKTLMFRYYYKDSDSKNDVSIQLTVDVDSHGTIVDVSECSLDFLTGVLSYME